MVERVLLEDMEDEEFVDRLQLNTLKLLEVFGGGEEDARIVFSSLLFAAGALHNVTLAPALKGPYVSEVDFAEHVLRFVGLGLEYTPKQLDE